MIQYDKIPEIYSTNLPAPLGRFVPKTVPPPLKSLGIGDKVDEYRAQIR